MIAQLVGWLLVVGSSFELNKPERLLTIQRGEVPIIISAPHGGRTPIANVPERRGNGIDKFVVVRDTNTDTLAELLSKAIAKELGAKPYLVIAHFERKYCDVNRPAQGAYEHDKAIPYYELYHRTLADACKEIQRDYGRGLLIDLHGQAADAEAIFRGTNNGRSVKALVDRFGKEALTGEKSILGQMGKLKYKVIPANDSTDNEDKRFTGGYIVQTYGSSAGNAIDAIQLETGGSARAKNKLEQTAKDLATAIHVFRDAYLPTQKRIKKD